jgi:hypothetical protein
MATLALDLVHEARRFLLTTHKEVLNRLAGAVNNTSDVILTLEFDLANDVAPGSLLSINLEEFHVWSVNTTNRTATVQRAVNGSAKGSHSVGDLVYVRPLFTHFRIFRTLNDDLSELSSLGLYRVKTLPRTYNSAVKGYDLAEDLLDILEIRKELTGTDKNWPRIRSYDVAHDQDAAAFPSGKALFLHEPGTHNETLHISYAATFSPLVDLTSDVQTVTGLPATANDLPPLGVAIRLMAGREVKRNFPEHQDGARRGEEVPPGAQIASYAALRALRAERLKTERNLLRSKHPRFKRVA